MPQHANFSAMFFTNYVTSAQTFPFAQLLESESSVQWFQFLSGSCSAIIIIGAEVQIIPQW